MQKRRIPALRSQRSFIVYFARAGILAAVYVLLSLIFYPISFGPVQSRISEVMCILPVVFPEAIWGLFVGCIITNLFSSANVLADVIFGSLATLLAAICTRHFRYNRWLCPAFPALFNAVFVGFVLTISETSIHSAAFVTVYLLNALSVGISEAIILYAIALPALSLCRKKYPRIFTE